MGRALRNFKLFLTLATVFTVLGLLYLTGDALAPDPEGAKRVKARPRSAQKKERGLRESLEEGSQSAVKEVKRLLNKARREIDRMMR